MLSLVNYGSSDEEDNITDEEEVTGTPNTKENGLNHKNTDKDLILEKSTKIQLPQPKEVHTSIVEEDDDEFLHKKETPEVPLPPPPKVKQKVKITIPKLSDFKDDDDDENDVYLPGPTATNKKSGLLGMLPKPAHSIIQKTKSTPASISSSSSNLTQKPSTTQSSEINSTVTNQEVKKVGLIPYTLMDHKKTVENSKKKSTKRKGKDSDDESDDDNSEPFFTFNSNEDLPQVNEDEIKAMVEREANRLELRKMQAEGRLNQFDNQQQSDYSQYYEEQPSNDDLDQQAMKALVGGTKAKRTKLDGIQIVDLSDKDVLPDKEAWLRKSLAGETSFIPTGKIDEKGPALAKRKHQISYLAMRAEKNVAELEAMWAANRQNNREGRSKYGF